MEITYRRIIAIVYGLLCHGLFVAGVGMMIFQMYFGMSRCLGTLVSPVSWFADALLLIQFPLAHSFLLSPSGRRWLTRLAPGAFSVDLSSRLMSSLPPHKFLCSLPSGRRVE